MYYVGTTETADRVRLAERVGCLMEFTEYFLHTRQRPDRRQITDGWIQKAIDAPIREVAQSDGRIRVWCFIPDENKYLRVVLLPDRVTVHNAFFDRSFKEEQE